MNPDSQARGRASLMARPRAAALGGLLASFGMMTGALAFEVDATLEDVAKAFATPTVATLAVGAQGFINAGLASYCVEDNELRLPGATRLVDAARANELTLHSVERLEEGAVAVTLAGGGTVLPAADLQILAAQVSHSPVCADSHPGQLLLDVRTLMGATSLTGMVQRGVGGGDAAPAPTGGWEVASSTSPTTGAPTVIVSTRATNSPSITLAVRCRDSETALYVVTDTLLPLSDDYSIQVEARRDDDYLRAETATTSATRESFFLRNAVAKTVLMLGAAKYELRYTDFSGTEHNPVFDVTGLDMHLPRVRQACGW